ncbi:MAG: 30S ribosomal protein S12 methylthiotransferase RimO [Chlamydiae bacterium]|nr:30S ribosomal protein S12 methylthiotransferase RimO [Chlamydiota bacterium]MBI3277914.1 30S ribosomal protein S12 methylthiotransferase RimO [Chlamydiota bacterium]
MMEQIKVGLVSLGCPKALVDSEVMAGVLKTHGISLCREAQEADVIVINTCGFLQASTQESMDTIGVMKRLKKEGKCRGLVVAGCLVERYPERIMKEHPEVDAILGTSHFEEVAMAVEKVLKGERYRALSRQKNLLSHRSPIDRLTPKHFAYVKIAEGCDHPCRFCVIPRIKGRHQSRSIEDIEMEVQTLAHRGTKEIVLVAQDSTDYGRDIYQEQRLPQLLRRLCKIEGIEWIRILYAYPSYVSKELVSVMALEPKICKYLDIPLQHADDEMLKAMARMGSQKEYRDLIRLMRKEIDGLALRTTFIVGFPGETEERFQNLLDFMKEIRFERLGVFEFSREPGTYADKLEDQVPQELKETRKDRAMKLQQEISKGFTKEWVGKSLSVLCDQRGQDPRFMEARAYFDTPEIDGAVFVYDDQKILQPGDQCSVKVIEALEYDLVGEMNNNGNSKIKYQKSK